MDIRNNKKGKGGISGDTVVIATIALLLVGVVAWVGLGRSGAPEQSIADTSRVTDTGTPPPTTALVECPSAGQTSGQVRYKDSLAATNTYLAPTVYFVPLTASQERVTSGTLQTDGTFSTAVNLKCLSSGTEWQPVAVANAGASQSAVGDSFIAQGAFVQKTIVGKATDELQFKIEDLFTGGAKYFNISGCEAETQGYQDFNGSLCIINNDAGTTGTSLTLGTDGYIDSRIYVKTNTTKTQFGEDGLRTWLLVDADGSSWSEPIVFRGSGNTLVNELSSLATEDVRGFSGYEFAYNIGAIGDRENTIGFYMAAMDGVNPGTSADPTVEFCAESRYNSNKLRDTVRIGCWDDAATQALVATTARQRFQFNVA